jgi:hypothetical protein
MNLQYVCISDSFAPAYNAGEGVSVSFPSKTKAKTTTKTV